MLAAMTMPGRPLEIVQANARPVDNPHLPPGLAKFEAFLQPLLHGLDSGAVGICLCDPDDDVRYVNDAFATVFFGSLPDRPDNFVDALAHAIQAGSGINLETMTLEDFVPRVKLRRKQAQGLYRFALNMVDGSWWWVNDHKLENGWLLVIASEISTIKEEEVRLRRAHAAAIEAAQTDFLTELTNRRYGYEQANAALTAFKNNRLPLTIAVFDIDHFKRINDDLGHEAGDRVLIQVAKHLRHETRMQDQVSRTGGEEFMLVMPETSLDRAEKRVRDCLLNIPPVTISDTVPPLQVTVSVGLASAHATDVLSDVIRRADAALYRAKANGRHRVEVSVAEDAEHESRDPRDASAAVRDRCLDLLRGGHLVNVYQPIVELRTGRLIGVETLGRLRDGTTLLQPATFLPHFDGNALALLFHASLRQTLALLVACQATPELWASINVPPHLIVKPNFAEVVIAAVKHSGVAAERITLEILENEDFLSSDQARPALERLRLIGFRIAIDDLGTGHSSLARLRDLPIDKVKLDRSFVQTIARKPESLHFVASMKALAQGLQKAFIVEGVETDEVREALAILGVEAAQGYGIALPMPAAALQAWMAEYRPRQRAPHPESWLGLYATHMNTVELFTALRNQTVPVAMLCESRDGTRCGLGHFIERMGLQHSAFGAAHREFQRATGSFHREPAIWEAASNALWGLLHAAIEEEGRTREQAA